jgi:hypothetical protein
LIRENPDFVVVTGDLISEYAWDFRTRPWASVVYKRFASVLEDLGIYWAITIGNHDFMADVSVRGFMDMDM